VIHEGQPVVRRGPSVEDARAVCVLLHGRGRSPDDVLLLAERIGLDDVAYVAPAAADNSWWPGSFLAPIAENEPWRSSALGVVDALLHSLGDHTRIVLGGFSQGAVMALALGLGRGRPTPAAIVALSGFVPTVEGFEPDVASRPHLKAAIAHGSLDPIIPVEFGRAARDLLRAGGVEPLYAESPVGHTIDPATIPAIRDLVLEATA
jgi:phospholipase/carboxylesterase